MLTLIENADVFDPQPRGKASILLSENRILKIGEVDRRAVENLGIELEYLDATDCIVTPGFIDPHQHLLGGSGEKGFASQTPEIYPNEIIQAGITTVVGCLGVDTTMKTLAGLLAKAKALNEEGISAFIWSGGYNVPPTTISGTIRNDILFIREVIGAGEIAISDERAMNPQPHELAQVVTDAYVGGMLSKKAGITHFHVGEGEKRLEILRTLIEEFEISPEWLYPTHIERSEKLMLEAIELNKRGSFVDIDTVEEDLSKWLKFYLENGGNPEKLTVSSDASITSPKAFFEQIMGCLRENKIPLEKVLSLVTANTSKVLKLERKGFLRAGNEADVLVLRKDGFEIKDVIAGGRRILKNGRIVLKEKFLEESNRQIRLEGNAESKQ